jgi:hypothetical protein
MRKIKLVTLIDRLPNYLFDIWINYHLKYFKTNEILIAVINEDIHDIQNSIKTRYNIDSFITDNLKNVSNDMITLYKTNDINKYNVLINYSRDLSNQIQHTMLDMGYDVMIWLDMDELLYHENLVEILQTFNEEIIRPQGVEIIQHETENAYDEQLKLNDQRSYIQFYNSKNKPIITRKKVTWGAGRHFCEFMPHGDITKGNDCYPGLYLVHLDKIDIDRLKKLREDNFKIYSDFNVNFKFDNWIQECRDNLIDGNWIINKISN